MDEEWSVVKLTIFFAKIFKKNVKLPKKVSLIPKNSPSRFRFYFKSLSSLQN